MILYRPVGLEELELISNSGFRAFPPRTETQPVLYAVIDEPLAAQTAHDWNANDPSSGWAGFVVRFTVDDNFVSRYSVHGDDAGRFRELWIPAADVEELNRHITGPMQVTQEFYGRKFSGVRPRHTDAPAGNRA